MTLTLRYMQAQDIVPVVAIDREAFSTPWSPRSYAYEISESSYSYMVVLEKAEKKQSRGWRRWFNGKSQQRTLIGYGGLWNIVEEAHISTIATHPDWRGQGYGELLLAAMIQRSINLEASYVVLEVRVSNVTAQNLYKKYEFKIAATKRRYYHDDGEDAYDMRFDLEDPQAVARFQERYAAIQRKHAIIDHYTATPRPTV